METAPRPEPAQLVHSLPWTGQADWAVTSLPSGVPEAAEKSPQLGLGFSSLGAAAHDESKQIVRRKLVSLRNGETEAQELGYLDLFPLRLSALGFL